MAQWIKAIAAKPDDLCLNPCTQSVEREPIPKSCPLTSTCVLWSLHAHTHTPDVIFKNKVQQQWLATPAPSR